MSVEEMQEYRDLVLENIEYDHLCREFSTYREDLDEIVELIVGNGLRQTQDHPHCRGGLPP